MKRALICAAFALTIASVSHAQRIPHDQWWHRPDLAERLGITEDQKTKLDVIFRGSADELIDRRGQVEKASVAVHGELDQPQII